MIKKCFAFLLFSFSDYGENWLTGQGDSLPSKKIINNIKMGQFTKNTMIDFAVCMMSGKSERGKPTAATWSGLSS